MPKTTMRISVLLLAVSLVACGGGSSTPTSVIGALPGTESANAQNENQALPNFVMSDFVGTSVYTGRFTWAATLTNTGSGSGEIPSRGLMMESITSDFSTGAATSVYSMQRLDNVDDRTLMPGESAQVTGFNTVAGFGVLQGRFDWTVNYIKFWFNPDWGTARFRHSVDGENKYASSFDTAEENYEDNESNVIEVVHDSSRTTPRCMENDFEENDSIDQAQPIILGQEYASDLCLDSTDIFSVDLVAGKNYEVIGTGFDFEQSFIVRFIVIGPDSTYILDKVGVYGLFNASMTGNYKIVITIQAGEDHGYWHGFFTITEK